MENWSSSRVQIPSTLGKPSMTSTTAMVYCSTRIAYLGFTRVSSRIIVNMVMEWNTSMEICSWGSLSIISRRIKMVCLCGLMEIFIMVVLLMG
jgi:hypothetical protein